MRPIADIMFGDFLMLVMDQIGNQAAKIHYMSGGKERPDRHSRNDGCDQAVGGAALAVAARLAEPHSRPEGRRASTLRRERLFKAAVRDNNPVVFFEDKISYTKVKGLVPTEEYVIPLGVADVKREGSDCSSRRAAWCRWRSARRRCSRKSDQRRSRRSADDVAARRGDADQLGEEDLALHRDGRGHGATASRPNWRKRQEGAFYDLDGPVRRLCAMHVPIPFSPSLEDVTVPTEKQAFDLARQMVNR